MILYKETQENVREYKGYNLRREDPYGFWSIYGPDDKLLVEESFTSPDLARNRIDELLNMVQKTKKRK